MAKRKSRKEPILGGFTFNKIDPYGGVEGSSEASTRLHIESIMPDPDQPRRLLPRDLYVSLYTGEKRPVDVVHAWRQRATAADAALALRESFARVEQLAATIEHRDLINPITVRKPNASEPTLPKGVQYMIVTGERRWWAHVLLTADERPIRNDQNPDRIKASIVPTQDVRALQLIENVARADLSLIEKAQGILALRDELAAETGSKPTWDSIERILGVSKSYRTRILKVLKLSPEAQELVAQHNLAEKTIRPITERLQHDPALQLVALRQIALWQSAEGETASHRRVADYVATLLEKPSKPTPNIKVKKSASADASWWVTRFEQRVGSTLKLFDALNDDELRAAARIIGTGHTSTREQLQSLRDQLDKLLSEDK